MHYAVSAAICAALAAGISTYNPPSETTRIRPLEPEFRRLIQDGANRSATFHRLVQRIDESDGIVYVQSGSCSISAATACLMLSVREAARTRYLRIHVTPRRAPRDEQIAMLGHELQHANEVLASRWVRNSADAYALFIRIGSAGSIRTFETAEAQRVEAAIANELKSSARRSSPL